MTGLLERIFLRPLPSLQIAQISVGLIVATAAYCLAYTAFSGNMATLQEAFLWPLFNVLPWFLCFEFGKRLTGWFPRLVAILAVMIGMSALDSLVANPLSLPAGDMLFQMTRRIPGAALVVALFVLTEIARHFALTRAPASGSLMDPDDLPLVASQILWVSAAGNYVELHGAEKPVLHRAPISAVERKLADQGFVRIHRSVLVSRRAVEKVVNDLVILKCGQQFKIGNRYRSALA
ncbi:MAG: LytTR family DNA-binding domain-containing protein [Pseudomonadota bacterium]